MFDDYACYFALVTIIDVTLYFLKIVQIGDFAENQLNKITQPTVNLRSLLQRQCSIQNLLEACRAFGGPEKGLLLTRHISLKTSCLIYS